MMWKYTDGSNTAVMRTLSDGSMESRVVTDPEIAAWLEAGNLPLPNGDENE